MLNAKRILALIAIALCVMQILSLMVRVTGPKQEERTRFLDMVSPKEEVVARRTVVWYVGGIVFLGVAALLEEPQAWLQLSFAVSGVAAMLVGCAGGGVSGRVFVWTRLILSFLTLAILILISLLLSRRRPKTG